MPFIIPVLMYHSLEGGSERSSQKAHKSTTISLETFHAQIELLHGLGFTTIDLEQLITPGHKPTDKHCIITFDDGFYSTMKDAAPVLEKFNFKAVLFLPVGPVGKVNFDLFPGFKEIKNDRPLTWEEVSQLRNKGWSIQSHGINHPRMSELTTEEIYKELRESKLAIERETKAPVTYFAYPFGDYDTRVLRAVRECGYKAAFTVHPGKTSATGDLFRLRRIEINSFDDQASFLNKIITGYASKKEKYRSFFRDLVYAHPSIKDFLRSLKN